MSAGDITDNPYHFESQVFEYYEYMWGGFDDAGYITAVEKVDDYTVKFVLSVSLAPFLANLAMDMFAISSPAAIEEYGEDYGTPSAGCVGTGPFKFVEWVEGDHITVAANDDYWGGRPKVDEIVWRVIPDDSARYLALKAGDIHALETATAEDIATADADPELYVLARPALNTGYLAFNYKIEEMQDVNFRKAVVHAINRQGLVENFLGKYGEVATNFLPPLMMGHNDAIEDWEYSTDLAKQALADAGFPDGHQRSDHRRGSGGCGRERGARGGRQDPAEAVLHAGDAVLLSEPEGDRGGDGSGPGEGWDRDAAGAGGRLADVPGSEAERVADGPVHAGLGRR